MIGRSISCASVSCDLLHQREQVDLDPAAGRARDQLGAAALAQAEAVQHLQAVLDLEHRIAGVADPDGVADAVGEQRPERHDAADGAGLLRPGVGHAQVQRVVEPAGDLRVDVDHEGRVHRLGADHDVVEVLRFEDLEVLLELRDHDGEEVAVPVVGEELAELLHALLLVPALDDRALVDADADGDARVPARVDHGVDLLAIGDVAGVEPDLVDARLDRLEGPLVVEVHVGDDRHAGLVEDLRQGRGVLALGHRHADDVRPGGGEPVDLGDARVDVVGVAGGHRLDGHRRVAADADDSGALVADGDRTGRVAMGHWCGL